jgi:hypothetical protein
MGETPKGLFSRYRAKFGAPLAAIGLLYWVWIQWEAAVKGLDKIRQTAPVLFAWLLNPGIAVLIFVLGLALILWAYYDLKLGDSLVDKARDFSRRHKVITVLVFVGVFAALGLGAGLLWVTRQPRPKIEAKADKETKVQPPVATPTPSGPNHAHTHNSTPHPTPAPSIQQQGQNNIAQIGNNNQATINAKPPSRRIIPEYRRVILPILAAHPGTVEITSVMNDAESYQFAEDWRDVLTAAGWTIKEMSSASYDKPMTLPRITFHGDLSQIGQSITVPKDDPVTALGQALQIVNKGRQISGHRAPNRPEGIILLEVGSQPLLD